MPQHRTRAEHLQWAKDRALEYVEAGDLPNAWASFVSDLRKHPDTSGHRGIELGTLEMVAGTMKMASQVRDFIQGCN